MRKLSKTLLSLLLIAAMLASFVVLPAAAEEPAAEQPTEAVQAAETQSTAAVEGFDLSIVMLDCGRKYFSVDSIKQIIDNASAAGFGYIMLGVGNDGMRFLLDDMSLTVNGTTYESDAVKSAIHAGNEAYYNFDVDELTQSEMDAVLAYAKEKGMGVIPMLNTPGHMDAILAAATSLTGTNCAYSGSARTIDVTNSTAVAFTQAFVQKYVDYFAGKGCKYFNMGADEYANDKYLNYTGMGFGKLQSEGKYSYYVTYVNDVAAMIKNAGMTPMAFNDGIYFNNNTSSGTFDTDIVICYWSNGWSGYSPMPASDLANKGFKMVNTHGDYYWVLGKPDAQCSASKAKNFDIKSFPGSTIANPSGAMFCIWADYPGAETEASVISKTADTIAAFGAKLPDTKDKVKWNTPVVKDNTVSDNGVSVVAPGLTKVTVTETGAPETLPEGVTEVKAWEIKPEIDGVPYEGEAKVTLKLPAEWVGADIFGGVMEDGKVRLIKEVELDEEASTLTFTVPHFSTVLAAKANKTETIEVELGTPKTVELPGNLMEDKVNPLLNDEIATVNGESKIDVKGETTRTLGDKVTAKTTDVTEGTYIISNGNGRYLMRDGDSVSSTTDILKATKWTLTKSNSAFTLFDGHYYLRNRDTTTDAYLNLVESTNTSLLDWNNDSTGLYISIRSSYGIWTNTYRLRYSGNSWNMSYNNGTGALYQYKENTTKDTYKTVLTITGNKAGTTTLTLGNTTYTIKVNYKTQQVSVAVGETTTFAVSGTPDTTGLDTTIAEVTIANNKMTIKGLKAGNTSVRVGDTVYNISVSKVDLTKVDPLTVEYWITNARPTGSDNKQALTIAAADAGVATDDGVDISTLIPEEATKDGRTLYYWRSRLLDPTKTNTSTSGTEKQTNDSGDDDTYSGVGFTKVRFYGTNWQVLTENNEWKNVSVDNYQLVAYYLEYIKVTDEVESFAADWGNKGDNTVGGWLDSSNYCSLSIQVVYEDGTTNPADTTATDLKAKTIVYGYWPNGRGIGTVMFEGTEYEIYKVTAETGEVTADISSSNSAGYKANVTKLTWDKNETTVWEGDPSATASVHNSANNFSKEGALENLTWDENKEAILLRVYVKAKPKADSLKVRYIDKTTGKQIHEYDINVKANTYFDPGFAKGTGKNTLVNNEVTNYFGITQKVSAELKDMPQIKAAYRYSDYELVEVVRKSDSEVILYYTFNDKHIFVVDFGVPLKIKATDIGVTVPAGDSYWTEATCTGAVYGETKIANGEGLTYTATKPMLGIETLNVTLATGTGEDDKATHTIYLVPATTVYYEQNVATYSNGWKLQGTAIAADKYQQTQKGRTTGHNFGFDPYYEANQLGANGSVEYTSTPGESAQLTFKGTGMELYLRTQNANETSNLNETDATNHSYMLVQVYAGDTADANSLKRMSFVDVNNLFVQSKTGYGYNTPCWTVDGMTYGTYTVVVRYVKGTTYGLAIDGFRVTNTLNPSDATTNGFYADVGEANMQTAEIRNMVLAKADVPALADNWYKVGNDVIDAVFDNEDATRISGAVLIKKNYNESTGGTEVTVDKDLVNIGPKNEIYLNPGEAVVMQLTGSYASVQVGMRSLTGTPVQYKINTEEKTMNSTVDMYYKVNLAEGKLVIQNVSGGILALTRLKVTSAAATTNDSGVIPQTTPEAIRYAMALMRGIDVPQFTDVAEDAWYHDYVYDLVYRGVVNGMTATTYEPEGKLTRAQFVKLLACSLADAETLKTYEGKHPFKDSEGHWAEAYIAWAKDKGIVEGVSATEFDPEAPITREQMATIFGRYALKQGIELPKDAAPAQSFPDADKISGYAKEFVELMRLAGILNGYEDGTFRPQNTATRAEAAKLFSVFLSITDKL